MKDSYYIGFDAHAKTAAVAWAGPGATLEYHGTCVSSKRSVQSTLRKIAAKLGMALKDLKVGAVPYPVTKSK